MSRAASGALSARVVGASTPRDRVRLPRCREDDARGAPRARARLPLLAKDDVKEAIADAIPAADREGSRRLVDAAYRVLFTVVARLVDAGTGLVLESNFERGRAEAELAPLVARTRAVLVQCQVPDALALERYRARAASGIRHGVHKDDVVIEMWGRGIRSDHGALELGIPVITVDTSDRYMPLLPEIVAAVQSSSLMGTMSWRVPPSCVARSASGAVATTSYRQPQC